MKKLTTLISFALCIGIAHGQISMFVHQNNSSTDIYNIDDVRKITEDDIIGAISIEDTGLKGSANSVSVTIPDPQVKFDNRTQICNIKTYTDNVKLIMRTN